MAVNAEKEMRLEQEKVVGFLESALKSDILDEMNSDFEMSRELGWSNDYYKLSEK